MSDMLLHLFRTRSGNCEETFSVQTFTDFIRRPFDFTRRNSSNPPHFSFEHKIPITISQTSIKPIVLLISNAPTIKINYNLSNDYLSVLTTNLHHNGLRYAVLGGTFSYDVSSRSLSSYIPTVHDYYYKKK